MPPIISQYKITLLCVIARHIDIASFFQQGTQQGDILMLNRYIQIIMNTGLSAEQCIHTPPAINDDFNIMLINNLDKLDHILGSLFRIIQLSFISYIYLPGAFPPVSTSAGVPAP